MVDAILLAGGYATRLYPLTENQPKALLRVGNRRILDRIVDDLLPAPEVGRFFLVTNAKFAGHFTKWAAERTWEKPIEVLNDGTTSNEDRLGALGDVKFVLENAHVHTENGLFVLGTDNLAQFDILQIVRRMLQTGHTSVFGSRIDDHQRLCRMGVAVIDESGRLTDFSEKPEKPKSNRAVPPFYAYSSRAVELLDTYLDSGENPDAPGHFIEWLHSREPVYGVLTDETVYDIGTVDSYESVCRLYGDKLG